MQSNGRIPTQQPFIVQSSHQKLLAATDSLAARGRRVNVLVKGQQGCGKSELPRQYAASRKRPFFVFEVGRLSDPSQIFGYMSLQPTEAGGQQTVWVNGQFTEAIQTEAAVIHLQEINRPESDKALNAIFSVLDDTNRGLWLDELGDYVEVAAGVTVFASMNEGMDYIGTLPMDPALEDRFHIKLRLGYLPQQQETNLLMSRCGVSQQQAEEIVQMAGSLRNNQKEPVNLSIRDTLGIAELVSVGIDKLLAFRSVVAASEDLLESILLQSHLAGEDQKMEEERWELLWVEGWQQNPQAAEAEKKSSRLPPLPGETVETEGNPASAIPTVGVPPVAGPQPQPQTPASSNSSPQLCVMGDICGVRHDVSQMHEVAV